MKKMVVLGVLVLLSLTACAEAGDFSLPTPDLGGAAGVADDVQDSEQDVPVEPDSQPQQAGNAASNPVVALPEPTGLIAFVSDREGAPNIYVMDANGEKQVRISGFASEDHFPRFSPDGSHIVFVSTVENNTDIYLARVDGTDLFRLTNDAAKDGAPSWSPDGTRIAFETYRTGDWEIYLVNIDGTNLVRLTENPSADTSPVWSPDGTRIAFVSGRDGNSSLYMINVDGTGLTRLNHGDVAFSDPDWSSDGKTLAFRKWTSAGLGDICIVPVGLIEETCYTQYAETGIPAWSPDGTKLAYRVRRDDTWVIEVTNIYDRGSYQLVTTDLPKSDPVWSPDGNWIGYQVDLGSNMEIIIKRANGDDGGEERRLTKTSAYDGELTWFWR